MRLDIIVVREMRASTCSHIGMWWSKSKLVNLNEQMSIGCPKVMSRTKQNVNPVVCKQWCWWGLYRKVVDVWVSLLGHEKILHQLTIGFTERRRCNLAWNVRLLRSATFNLYITTKKHVSKAHAINIGILMWLLLYCSNILQWPELDKHLQ